MYRQYATPIESRMKQNSLIGLSTNKQNSNLTPSSFPSILSLCIGKLRRVFPQYHVLHMRILLNAHSNQVGFDDAVGEQSCGW